MKRLLLLNICFLLSSGLEATSWMSTISSSLNSCIPDWTYVKHAEVLVHKTLQNGAIALTCLTPVISVASSTPSEFLKSAAYVGLATALLNHTLNPEAQELDDKVMVNRNATFWGVGAALLANGVMSIKQDFKPLEQLQLSCLIGGVAALYCKFCANVPK